jgi:starch synthase
LLQQIFYFESNREGNSPAHFLAFLQALQDQKEIGTDLNDIISKVITKNQLGPIVFVTPELGRFSTVGGIGVMVNELTQALAALGCEVHVISPYYNFNRKGKTDYLKDEGIHYKRNIVTYI